MALMQEEYILEQVLTLQNKKLCNLYSSPDTMITNSRWITWVRYVERMGQTRNTYKISLRKPQGKKRFEVTWQDNIKIQPKEIRCGKVDRIDLDQDMARLQTDVNMVICH
jgi:hypothetical protein